MILIGKDRDFNERFEQLCSHYLFEPVACTPAAGWEKGQVERQVGLVREQFFTPRLAAKDFVELNEILREKCLEQARTRRHPTQQDKLIMEVFVEERRHLLAVPRPFDGYAADEARVSRTSLVRYDRNHYSVPVSEVGRTVTVRAYAGKIKIISQGRAIAFYDRQFGRGKTMFDPWHICRCCSVNPVHCATAHPFSTGICHRS